MNQKGIDYCKEMETKYASLSKDKRFKLPIWGDSDCQERMMRLGREVRYFDVDTTSADEMERIARATLIEDKL